jgi:hypothetical protein
VSARTRTIEPGSKRGDVKIGVGSGAASTSEATSPATETILKLLIEKNEIILKYIKLITTKIIINAEKDFTRVENFYKSLVRDKDKVMEEIKQISNMGN